MKELLESVLNGQKTIVNLGYVVPDQVESCLGILGAKETNDRDFNGWDHDFWHYWIYEGKEFCFSGSWYYGDYIFSIRNDE